MVLKPPSWRDATQASLSHPVFLFLAQPHDDVQVPHLATRNLHTHRSSSRSSMLRLLWTTDSASGRLHGAREQQAGQVLVRSDHPARGRATTRLSSCPQLMSHDRTPDDASFSSGKQTEKKKRCSEPRSLVRRFAERFCDPKFGWQFSRTRARPWVEMISNFDLQQVYIVKQHSEGQRRRKKARSSAFILLYFKAEAGRKNSRQLQVLLGKNRTTSSSSLRSTTLSISSVLCSELIRIQQSGWAYVDSLTPVQINNGKGVRTGCHTHSSLY